MAKKYFFSHLIFLFVVMLFAFPGRAYSQCPVVPAFTFSKACITDFRISFTNGSSVTPPGAIDYYRWDFGDGFTSAATSPTHTYIAGGIYQVILFVYDTSGCYDSVFQNVPATALPEGSFTYIQSGCGEISFINTCVYAGSMPAFFWTFGDGQISTDENPIHTYATGGTPSVSLTVTDEYGCSDTYIYAINVFSPATVDFTYSSNLCETVQFNENVTGTGAITYLWDFGDGNFSSLPNPIHTFALGASYTVVLTVDDQYCTGITDTSIIVLPLGPVASFTFNPDGQCASTPIDFDANASTGTSLNYSWDFGDGTSASGLFLPITQHQYNSYNNAACDPGQSYPVELIVADGIGCADTAYDIVNTQRVPQPLLNDLSGNNFQNCYSVNPADPTDTLWVGNLTPNMGCISHLDIEWGDGTDTLNITAGDFPLMHVYLTMGEFPLTVTAYGTNGCVSDTTYVVANQVNPSVGISGVGANSGCAPFTAKFVLHGYTGNSQGTTYEWDFDDGTTVIWDFNEPYINDTIEHIYTQSHCANPVASSPDGYVPSVTASNACGSWTSTIQYITIFETPIASFSLVDSSNYGCFSDPVCFANYTYHGFTANCDSSVNFTWDFGDGNSSILAAPCHSYSYPGTYQVNLLADNPLCGGTDTTIAIHITGTHADFAFDTVCLGTETHFNDLSWAYDDSSFLSNPSILITDYLWDFGDGYTSALQHPNHVFPDTGTYNVCLTVTSQYACDSTICKEVYVGGIFIDNVVVDSISCFNADDGQITVNVVGGIPIIAYTLNPASITNTNGTFNGLAPGAYWILAEDAMGCWDETDTIYLLEPDPISIDSVQFTDISCHDDDDGTITTFASGGTNPLSYTLIPAGTNNATGVFTGLTGGNYRVVVEDANGCPADTSAVINILNPPSVIIDSVQSMDITCHNADDGSIQVWAQGGTGTISYTLNPGGTTNITGIFNALSGGTYYVVVSDDNMCDDTTANIDIINPVGIMISSAVATDMSCHDTLDGTITVVASGGTGILTYTLLPSFSINTSGIFTGIGAGSYYVRIEDASGCADSTATLIIANPDAIQITSEVFSDITCHNDNDGSITVTATGGTPVLSYTLMPLMITNGTGIFNSLMAGTYRVVVDDANACQADTSSFITITNPPELLIDSIQSMDISCFNADDGWIQVYTSGGTGLLTYTLNPGALVNNTGLYTLLSGGTYTVTVEDANGCNIISGNIDIINPSSVHITSLVFTSMSCHDTTDGSITVTAAGGTGTPQFTLIPSGTVNTTGVFTGLAAGTYYVRVDDGNACADSTSNITIVNPGEILITNEDFTPISCFNADDGIVEVIAGGGNLPYAYTLLPPNTQNGTGLFINLAPGTYYVIVEDANGCPSDTSSFFTLTNPPQLVIDSLQSMDISCNGNNDGWIQTYASGGTGTHTFTLNPAGISNSTGLFNGLSAGNYTVTVTDSNSCTTVSPSIVIAEPSAISSSAVYTDVTCYGYDNGTITITASGGVLPLDYSIDNGFSYFPFSNFSGLTPGSYFARVRDANGCETTGIPITIIEPVLLQITGFTPVTPSCSGCSDGELTVNVIGGTLPYSHSWSNGMSGNPITGIPSGWYTDTVSDANGCVVIDSVFLNEPGPLSIVLDSSNAVCYGENTGWVAVIASGGTTPYTYEWIKLPSPTVIGTNDTLYNADAGFYAVTVYDFFSNFLEDTIEVGQPDTLALSLTFSDTVCFGASNGWATVTAIGGIPPYNYLWSGGSGAATDSIYNLTAGTYTITVTDQNNCQTIDGITILENPELIVSANPGSIILCSGDSIQLNAAVSGGTLPVVSYQWTPVTGLNDPAIQSPMATPSISTVYTVLITDQRGCTAIDSLSIDVVPSPTADFIYQNPCASNVVNFLNLSNANGDTITLYSWDFGDGYFSNLQHPTHTYGTVDTTYTVSLIVQNANGCTDTIIQGVYVNPMLGLIVEADTACIGYPTQFNDTVTNPSTLIISYFYDFGDGNTASISDPTHLYAMPGIYNVCVNIEDTSGCVEATNITVRVYALPLPDFSDSTSCYNNITYFTDLTDVSSVGIASWLWNFGDGNTSTQQHPTHLYTIDGTYQVSLIIENTNGCIDSISKPVSVFPRPTAAFTTDTVCLGNPSSFVDLSSASFGVINSWYWDFGDGNFSTQQSPVYVYSTPGYYNVALIIQSSTGCSDTLIQVAGVNELPYANFSYTSPCEFSQTSFTDLSVANATSLTAWYWDFGDGYTSNQQDPQHVFPAGGTYLVNLTVTNSSGCVDDTTMNVVVASAPMASFTYSLASCANDTTYFTDHSLPIVGFITSWEWDFGDGNTSILQHPRHVYAGAGLFTVSLVVTNSLGCVDTTMQSLLVYPKPVADFSYGPGCMSVPTFFYDQSSTSSGLIASWEWDFGDPGSGAANQSTLQNPSHIYVFAGLYNVRLIVSNTNFCVDTIVQQIEVRPNPTAAFDFDLVCDDDTTVFLDQSLPATAPFGQWHWDFGDGNSTIYNTFSDSVFHKYNNPGQYHVTLTVTDTMGCSGLQVHMVTIYAKPTALFGYNQSCVNNLTHFTDYSNGSGADIVSWYWDFGDPVSGANNNSTLQHPTHQYGVAGDYFVTLWVTNAEGCENQTTQTITVTPGPVADFEADSSCVSFVTFFDNLSYAIGENIISWHWDFGDGTSSILQFPSHAYTSAGTYWVSLTVETENGCVDNIVKPVTIYELPVPDFDYTIPNCYGDSTYFHDLSWFIGGNIITEWHWDFGDGWTNTSDQNPVHEYALPGNYSVTLTVYDTNGCFNSVIKDVYVNDGPIASFDHLTTSCDTVYFTDQSIGAGATITSWYWDFGDPASGWNNHSTLQDPFHVFINSGSYEVMLVVTDTLGCSDTIRQTLDIYKPVADFDYTNSCVNSSTHFTDLSYVTGDVIVSWYWDFGDGTTSTVSDPIHIYTAGGTYFVTLTVTSSMGCVSNVIKQIEVFQAPLADFEFTSACFGEIIQFTDLSSAFGGGSIVSWDWDFGDGNTSNLQNPVHSYTSQGSYTVSLIVYDTNACYATHSENLGAFEGPDADFDATVVCMGQPTQFTDLSTTTGLPITEWLWDFGDGNTSVLQNPFHIYAASGLYTVTLTVTDLGGCDDVTMETVEIYDAPTAMFIADSVCTGHETNFTDLSIPAANIASWYWNFGDPSSGFNNFSFLQNPTHMYAIEGAYLVNLTVTDFGGCSHTVEQEIWVEPEPFANFSFTNEHCVGESVLFIDQSQTVNEIIVMWVWNFGDGTRDTIYYPTNPNIEHTYMNPGQHLVTLTVANSDGCVGSTSKPINILPAPLAYFDYSSACEDQIVHFNDLTNQNNGGQVINWDWNFDDPLSGATNTSQLQNPEHLFSGPGFYDVSLIVWNANSCRDTVVLTVQVLDKPAVDYYYDAACEDELTQFYVDDVVTNINTITSYLWDFGDGEYSNLPNPVHLFAGPGIFNVSLTVTDTSLCENTIIKEVTVDENPVAFFDITEPTCNTDSVFFDDLSSTTWGYIQTWVWDFDDGSPIDSIHFPDDPNVFHTYAAPGTYGATLTVINSQGCSHTYMREVDILAKPIANFHWSANPCQNEEVEFTDASFPNGQGNIITWYWEFDDPMSGINNTSVMQNPVHIFSEGGLYDVLLIVVNFNDCVDTIVKPISVNESPDVAFLWDYACEDTLTYFWPDSSIMNPSAVISWYWDFGDGQFSTEPTPTHNYENAGYYNVTLTIQDTGVCTNEHTQEIFVNSKPDAFFDVSEITCMGNPVFFDDLSSVPDSYIVEWHWDFGDGNDTTIFFPDEPDVWHSYAMDGTYPVTLTVTSADSCYGDEMLYVVIDAAPIALFDYDVSCYGTTTQFYDNSSGGGGLTITSWLWDFGDPSSGVNNSSTLQDPEHLYTAPGLYNVMLTITNVGGCIDTIVQEVQVNVGAAVDFYAEDSCLNLSTYFFIDPLVTDTNAIILYDWDFGDNSGHSNAMNPVHQYGNAGIFNVTLVITDTSGCSNMVMHETEVRDNPVALFEYEAACANDTAYFTDLSYTLNGDLVIAWEWDFGDPASGANNYSTEQNPVHVYTGQQNYDVKLVITTDHGCRDSIMIPLAVTALPTSNFSYIIDPCDPGLVFFTDSSTYTQSVITEWEWYMEPGSYSYIPDPHHIFLATDTTYNVRLTVTDANGCSDEIVKPVFIPEAFEVEMVSNQTCHLEPMYFSANLLSPIPDSIFSYSWNFGEPASGPNNTSIYPTPDHTYLNPGYYTVTLTAVDIHGCETIVYKQVLVDILPEPAFEYANALCDSTIYFTDLSSGSGANIISWLWDYGDGSPPELITNVLGYTEHFYVDDGVYTVHLTVTNENGCVNSTSMEVVREPCLNADFFVVNEAICERNTITFADSSSVDYLIEIWQWDFGDGTDTLYDIKSDTVNHYYGTAGDYNVTLVVYAIFNSVVVADTFTNIVKVRPTPMPDFICEPVCFGDASQFIDDTEHPGSFIDLWQWNFGTIDPGDTSAYKNPVFKYDTAGDYNVELITINQFGCMDSVRHDVRVNYLPLADYEYSVACEGERIYFTDLSDGFDANIAAWKWNFNDPFLSGDQSTEQNPYWKYEHQGTNTVSLIINNENGCADTVEYDVTVNNVPLADFTLYNNYNSMQGSVLLEDHSIDALDYLWDFGDGYEFWDDYPPISHIYEEDGEYVISLIVWNEHGCPDTTWMDYEFMFNTLFIPNALAPASNDPEVKVFQPKGKNLDEYYIAIHDSWGNTLWESDKIDLNGRPAESWDGTYNGTLLPTDVYIWRARAVFKDGTFWEGDVVGNNEGGSGTTSGTVTLVR